MQKVSTDYQKKSLIFSTITAKKSIIYRIILVKKINRLVGFHDVLIMHL